MKPRAATDVSAANRRPTWTRTSRGVAARVNGCWFEVASFGGGFRVSVSTAGVPTEPVSGMLDPTATADAPFQIVEDGTQVGVSSSAGMLLLDPATGAWTLRRPNGEVLVRPIAPKPHVPLDSAADAEAGDAAAAETSGEAIELSVGWPRDQPIVGYGCGNGPISLQHSDGRAEVGNGRAVVPFLWCPHGCAMLAVSEDDARPASWRSDHARSRLVWEFSGRTAHLCLQPAETLKAGLAALVTLTGRAPVPPRWTFGYLQSRWGWKDRADLEATLREFRRRRFPVDAFILDFEWYTTEPDYEVPAEGLPQFADFGVNKALFPELAAQLAQFHEEGLKIVAIRKPRLGNAATLREVSARGWTLPPAADGRKWSVREMDFRIPEFRAWYAERLEPLVRAGIDAWWNDEGESSFLTYYFWNVAELEAARRVKPRDRFWSLNRAFIPGLQRLGATAWTGDAYATWDALAATPAHLLNWGLAGMPYAGCDIGGFRGEAPSALFVRWIQAAVFFPMMRAHTSHEFTPRFPWLYGEEAEDALRQAFELRYRLLPYLYSLAHEAHATGLPLMRPLALEFPGDALVANLHDQWLFGDRVMAAPMLRPERERRVYLPSEYWYPLFAEEKIPGGRVLRVEAELDEIPAFIRAGSILVLGPVIESTAKLLGGPLDVQIYPGADAEFTLVEDDGATVDYLKGSVRRTHLRWDDARRALTWMTSGTYDGPHRFHSLRVRLMSPATPVPSETPLTPTGELHF